MIEDSNFIEMKRKSNKKFALGEMVRTAIVLPALVIANTTAAQTNNTITIGMPGELTTTVRSDGKLEVYKNGVTQFDSFEDWFCLRIDKDKSSSNSKTDYYRTASDKLIGQINFTLTDVASQTSGRHQFITKRCSSQFNGADFHVDYTMSYDTLNPTIIIKTVVIDASKLVGNISIKIASGFDTKFEGPCYASAAYIMPQIKSYNYSFTSVNVLEEEIRQLKYFGARTVYAGGQMMGFLSMDRPFTGASVQPNSRISGRQFLRDGVLNHMDFHDTYYITYSKFCERGSTYHTGVAYLYGNIPGNSITTIQTGLTFLYEIAGGLSYSWTNDWTAGAKDKTAKVGDTVNLNLLYINYTKSVVSNFGFDLDLSGLKIADKCSYAMIGGDSECYKDSGTYKIWNASTDATDGDIIIPVKAKRTGTYTIDHGSLSNAKKTLPGGSPATLTVISDVNLNSPVVYPAAGSTFPVRVKLPAGSSELTDTKVALRYSYDTAFFTPRLDTVVIPAGQDYVEFPISIPIGVNSDIKMNIEITGTDHPLISPGAISNMRIVVCQAVLTDDVVACTPGESILIDPLDNDLMLPCKRDQVIFTFIEMHVGRGNVAINPDYTVTYRADANANVGIDSFRYEIECPGVQTILECDNAAWIYVVVQRAVPERYVACNNTDINVGMIPVAGVSYDWYDAATNGRLLRSDSDTCTVRKGGAPTETFHVEAKYRGERLPRYPLVVEASEYCTAFPSPSSCAVVGRVLFAENFGGNDSVTPTFSAVRLPTGTTSYVFEQLQQGADMPSDSRYGIAKAVADGGVRHAREDHTSGAPDEGYMMVVNGTEKYDTIYAAKIYGLCAGMNLSFSAWIGNMTKSGAVANELYPRMTFTVRDLATNRLLAEYATGDIPSESTAEWKLYGFGFVPAGDSVRLAIHSKTSARTAATGNDFVIDDIELRLCTPIPVVVPPADSSVCTGSNVPFEVSYTDDGSYSRPLLVRWEYSLTGENNSWTKRHEDSFATDSVRSVLDIPRFNATDTGYYRITIGDSAAIDRPNCRVEHLMKIDTFALYYAADIRIRPLVEEIAGGATINLSRYVESVNHRYVEWDNYLSLDPDILDLSVGTIEADRLKPQGTYAYGYRVKAPCNTSAGKAFVQLDSLSNYVPKKTKTLVVCRRDESSESIILENVAGVSMDGFWTNKNPDPDDVIKKTLTNNAYSAHVFNAQKAYDEAMNSVYVDVHEGNPVKVFTLTLALPGQPNPKELIDLTIIITD